mgnify:CR=1 FL=1
MPASKPTWLELPVIVEMRLVAISSVVPLSSFGAWTIDITVCVFSLMSSGVTDAVTDCAATACMSCSRWLVRAATAAASAAAAAAAAADATASAAAISSADSPCGGGGGGGGGATAMLRAEAKLCAVLISPSTSPSADFVLIFARSDALTSAVRAVGSTMTSRCVIASAP